MPRFCGGRGGIRTSNGEDKFFMEDNPFMTAWNPSLDEGERVMGARFLFAGTPYPAISVEPVTFEQRATPGGRFNSANVTVLVRRAIAAAGGFAVVGKILTVRDQNVRVQEVDDDGDDSLLLICGPAGVEMPGR